MKVQEKNLNTFLSLIQRTFRFYSFTSVLTLSTKFKMRPQKNFDLTETLSKLSLT